jgi:hypothetical protein
MYIQTNLSGIGYEAVKGQKQRKNRVSQPAAFGEICGIKS